MTPEEALSLCMEAMNEDEAKGKVKRGIDSDSRWNEAIEIIRRVHGEYEIERINTLIELDHNKQKKIEDELELDPLLNKRMDNHNHPDRPAFCY